MSEDKVICNICGKEMRADTFSSHAIINHEDEAFALLSDDVIIARLSEWVE